MFGCHINKKWTCTLKARREDGEQEKPIILSATSPNRYYHQDVGCLLPAMRSTKYELNPWKLQTTAAEIFPLLKMFLLGDCSHDQKLMNTMTEWNGSEVPFIAPALHANDINNTVKHASRVNSPSGKIVTFTTRYNAFGKVKHHCASTNWCLKANYLFLLCIIKY